MFHRGFRNALLIMIVVYSVFGLLIWMVLR